MKTKRRAAAKPIKTAFDARKAHFVNLLPPVLRAINRDIATVEYYASVTDEYVRVRRFDGNFVDVCVTADSLSALLQDVVSKIS